MHKTVEIQGKRLEISTTKEADAILSSRKLPLCVQMELLFDALLSKKVRFLPVKDDANYMTDDQNLTVSVNEKLSTRFRPVMMQCEESQQGHQAVRPQQCHLENFPIRKVSPYIPRWLHIDFRFGHWFGEFGY